MTPHFDLTEAKTLVAFCAQINGPTLPLAAPPIAAGWESPFISPVLGEFENQWQLWKNPAANQYAIVIRGTVALAGSIIQDLMAVMIDAKGTLPLGTVNWPYQLADDPKAAVHYGFTLGMAILMFEQANGILTQVKNLVPDGADVFITGHSQGAAIATLYRSFLQYSGLLDAKRFSYKTYLFAQPKPDNDHYGWDFERNVSNPEFGFRLTNSQDWVPQVPLTLQLLLSLNQPNPTDVLSDGIIFRMFTMGFSDFQKHLQEVHLDKHEEQLIALGKIMQAQTHLPLAPAAPAGGILFELTLNFVNCGSAISLAGTPGTNPALPKDTFWQHHAAMYYKLLGDLT